MDTKLLLFVGWLLAPAATAMAAGPVTLVKDGKPAATIVIADEPVAIPAGKPPTVAYAAEELQRFIEKATGARLEIVPATQAPAKGTLLLVGRSALSEKHRLSPPTKPEGLRILAFSRGVAVLGEVKPAGAGNISHEVDRGTLHGVYEFLERLVGYRFFIHTPKDPDLGIVTPSVKTLTVPGDYTLELAPDFPYRNVAFATWSDRPAWMRATREGAGVGSGTGFAGINHTDAFFGRRFFADHPDWAAVKSADGTRDQYYPCYSQPGVLSARVQVTQDFYDGKGGWIGEHCHPGPRWIGFEPADLWDIKGLCICDRCTAQYQLERGRFGRNANLLFRHGVEFAAVRAGRVLALAPADVGPQRRRGRAAARSVHDLLRPGRSDDGNDLPDAQRPLRGHPLEPGVRRVLRPAGPDVRRDVYGGSHQGLEEALR